METILRVPSRHRASNAARVAVLALLWLTAVSAPAWGGYTFTDLGTLGGRDSRAFGINDAGQIVGWADTAFEDSHTFLYSGGVMQDLGTLRGNGWSMADGINASGKVVGWAGTPAGLAHAFLYSGGVMQDLGTLGGGTATPTASTTPARSSGRLLPPLRLFTPSSTAGV